MVVCPACSSQHQAQPVNKDLVMTFPSDGTFVPIFTSLNDATMEPNPEAGTACDDDDAPAESADAAIAAGEFLSAWVAPVRRLCVRCGWLPLSGNTCGCVGVGVPSMLFSLTTASVQGWQSE